MTTSSAPSPASVQDWEVLHVHLDPKSIADLHLDRKAPSPMSDTRTYVALVTETRNASGDFHVTVTPDTHPGITVTETNRYPGTGTHRHPRARRVVLPDTGALELLDADRNMVAAYARGQWANVQRTEAGS